MRITNSMMIDNMLNNLSNNVFKVSKYSDQLASNRRIVRLSSDPVGVLNSMTARQQIRRLEQFRKNVSSANHWATQAETAITEMEQVMISLKELTTAAMGTTNPSDKQNYALQVRELTDHILQMSNSVIGDQYLFGGFNTTNEPFKAIRDENGKITKVLYNGCDLTLPPDGITTSGEMANTTNAKDFAWTGSMTVDNRAYAVSADGDDIVFSYTDENGVVQEQERYTVTAADVQAGEIDLTAQGFGKISWTNKADPALGTPAEIAGAVAGAKTVNTQTSAVMSSKADSHLQWTGAIGENEKYQISMQGSTLIFTDSNGAEFARHTLDATDVNNGSVDLSALGLGTVSWSTTADPASNPPYVVPTTPEELAKLIGSAEFVTSKLGEEATQRVQFETGFNLKQTVTFNGVELAGTGSTNMFQTLLNLARDLENGASNDDLTKHLTALTKVQDNLIVGMVTSGARTEQLKTMSNRYSMDAINYEAIRSDVEDIDQAETIMKYQYTNTIFKQALASGSQIIQMSLMDFLK